ncbi:unnamed protein product [Penicillium camemberti]|uniref:Str. FM013 n=1 Tax=Penicillium camemberti (strain FM 013) TaxID=1429867 RepID=A0A0G4PGW0_PENC3|nr:unnamed protein product [Penicillium camemberti]
MVRVVDPQTPPADVHHRQQGLQPSTGSTIQPPVTTIRHTGQDCWAKREFGDGGIGANV